MCWLRIMEMEQKDINAKIAYVHKQMPELDEDD